MADEAHDQSGPEPEPEPEESATTSETDDVNDGRADDDGTADDTGHDDDHDEHHGNDEPRSPYGPGLGNASVFGTITLHGRDRDIETILDGSSALRLLKIFAQRRDGGLADVLEPFTSSARNAWLVADLEEFVAVSWWPGLPTKPQRTVIDPVVDAA